MIYFWELLTCVLMAHVKDSTNRNFVTEIVLIYYLKNLILISFQLIITISGKSLMLNMCSKGTS